MNQLDSKPFITWDSFFHDNLFMMTILMGPSLFTLFTGFLFAREYQERTINSFLAVPRPRIMLLFGKYAVMTPVMLVTLTVGEWKPATLRLN